MNKMKTNENHDNNEQKVNRNETNRLFFLRCLSRWFRDSGITCIWCLIENIHVSWDKKHIVFVCCSFLFSVFLFVFLVFPLFWQTENTKTQWETCFVFSKKRTSQTCCKGVSDAMCCGKIWDCLRVASVVKTKSVLIGHSLNRLNRMK